MTGAQRALLGLAAAVLAYPIMAASPAHTKHVERPIIAQLLSEPNRYVGRHVIIYGLVVESVSGSVFFLQDVSQRPLKIVAQRGLKAKVGDQLIVNGVFRKGPGDPYFIAKALTRTKVLGGGGCC
jgi:hypothetical protein